MSERAALPELMNEREAACRLGIAPDLLMQLCRLRLVTHYGFGPKSKRFDNNQVRAMRLTVSLIKQFGCVPDIEVLRFKTPNYLDFRGGETSIYFIRAGERGPIKVGHAVNPAARMRDLQTSHYERLRMLGHISGYPALEKAIHEKFHKVRMAGEWFRPTKTVLRFVEQTLAYEEARFLAHSSAGQQQGHRNVQAPKEAPNGNAI